MSCTKSYPNIYVNIGCKFWCRFIDLDTPLLLAEDPVIGGYEGISILSFEAGMIYFNSPFFSFKLYIKALGVVVMWFLPFIVLNNWTPTFLATMFICYLCLC